ncbi:threonine/serine exporter family protein [Chloroflexales bacterium ZM16-3]|nr:threonine/serine exporter family protein [Chloroflexales bacterium ZM16-3]
MHNEHDEMLLDQRRHVRAQLREVLAIALHAGKIMLESGANTARTEDTVRRIGCGLGAEELNSYVTPSGIIASIHAHDEHRTRILRIAAQGVDLSRMAAVVEVAARIERGELDRSGTTDALDQIAAQPRCYGRWITTIAVALAAACFSVLFGGQLWEFLVVLVAAGLGQYVRERLTRLGLNRLLITAVVSGVATFVALILALGVPWLAPLLTASLPWLPGPHPSVAICVAASAVLLVPGLLMVSSISDLFRGDTLAGMARATMALLTIFSIGIGMWMVLGASGVPVSVGTTPQPDVPLALLAAYLAAGGFAVLFDVPRRYILFSALVGAVAYGTRQLVMAQGMPPEGAALVAGLMIGVCAEILARAFTVPTSLFSIPGFIPLVPGVLAFRTILNYVNEDYTAGTADFVRAALITIGLAAGLGTFAAMSHLGRRQRADLVRALRA